MLLELGPIRAANAIAWIDYASETLGVGFEEFRARGFRGDALAPWITLVQRWAEAARDLADDDEFRWSGELPDDQGEFLTWALHQFLHRSFGGIAPDGVEQELRAPFNRMLSLALLDGLTEAGGACRELSEQLRLTWPPWALPN
ncbi:MAG: hypothetical protein GY745_20780 [Actinomycetia bacterium]|nr:hypothetical protein [Actinomycetes bacterium]MCP4087457.1 hypothetical protein [Actinomycetes bacterium]